MTSEPTTAAGRSMLYDWQKRRTHPPTDARQESYRMFILAIEAEARAADGHGDHPRDSYLYQGCPRCAQFREQARAAAERDVAAEPRWPSGPDARYLDLDDPATVERVARALQWMLFGTTDIRDGDLVDAKDLIAALQEKRDPGE